MAVNVLSGVGFPTTGINKAWKFASHNAFDYAQANTQLKYIYFVTACLGTKAVVMLRSNWLHELINVYFFSLTLVSVINVFMKIYSY